MMGHKYQAPPTAEKLVQFNLIIQLLLLNTIYRLNKDLQQDD